MDQPTSPTMPIVFPSSSSPSSLLPSLVSMTTPAPTHQNASDGTPAATADVAATAATSAEVLLIPHDGKVVLAVLYAVIVVVAFGGNLLVVFVVAATRRLRSVTNFFLASQGFSDALMSFVCVPWTFVATTLLDTWPFGETFCKVALYMQASSVYLSAFTMLAISMDRYRAVMDPLKPRVTKTTAGIIIASTWVLALVMSLPVGIYSKLTISGSRVSCYEIWPSLKFKVTYNYLLMLFQYLIPLVILTFTYTRIAVAVWVRRTPGEAINDRDRRMETGKKKMIRMMITVVVIYAVCWLPLHVVTVVGDHDFRIWKWRYIAIFWTACHLLAMSNICFNPLVYFVMNSKFREALEVICGRCSCRGKGSGDGRMRHASGTSGRTDGRLVCAVGVRRSLNPSAVDTRTSLVDRGKVAVRKFNGLPEMTWTSVTSTAFKDEICMTTLTSGDQKLTQQDHLAKEMNSVENSS